MKAGRSLQTILFTDLVGSTEKASALGDRAWRGLLERHHAIVREELPRWGGREITEAGDGFLALFDNPAQAIVCAATIRDRVGELGLGVRCGLHMGQLESQAGGSAGGIAVHIGARVAGEAGPGEVLVTSAVRDAESGSGFEFEDLGHHALKGVDREWQLFRVTGFPEDVSSLERGAWKRIADRVGSRALVAIAAALLLGLGSYALWRVGPGAAVASEIRSLAVLPLENRTGDPEQEYFVDGMTDAMITELSKLGSVKVISRTSVMRYRGSDKALREIADELGVDGVVEGSVARSASGVRITAQLVHAESDAHVWADAYDGDFSDVLLLQSDVARDIAREIAVTLTPQAEALLAANERVDPETYESYLRGMYHLNKSTPEDFQKGIAYFHEAVEKDPGSALAYAGLAMGYITLAHGPDPPPDVKDKAREAAERAIMLDPDLAEAHSTLATVLTYFDWEWETAEREYKRANELNPNLAMNRYHYAWFLLLFGRLDEAIEEHQRAQELDPLTPLHTAWLGALYNMGGRYDDGIAEARKTLEMDDRFAIGLYVTGESYLGKGMFEEAIEAHEAAVAANPGWRFALGMTYAAAGRRADALGILREIEAEEVTSYGAFQRAWLNMALENIDEAYRWLDYEPHHGWVAWIRVWPSSKIYRGVGLIREDPRFRGLMERMRLPPVTDRG
jgi:TolB-like protein/class 3 adenylate cyclase/Tfp pilus assembly protein PilF